MIVEFIPTKITIWCTYLMLKCEKSENDAALQNIFRDFLSKALSIRNKKHNKWSASTKGFLNELFKLKPKMKRK